jgi:hypothetical protein
MGISMRNAITSITLSLLVVAIVVLQSGNPRDGASTPENAVAQFRATTPTVIATLTGPTDLLGCIRFCWFAQRHPSMVVIYTRPDDGNQRSSTIAYDVVGESDGKWYSVLSGGVVTGPGADPPSLASLTTHKVERNSISNRYGVRRDYVLAIGSVRSPAVTRAAAIFDDGQFAESPVVNGMFAMFAPANGTCEVRLDDGSGGLLERMRPEDNQMWAFTLQREAPGGCQDWSDKFPPTRLQ